MTLKEMEKLIALQNDLSKKSLEIDAEDIFEYTMGLLVERWCKDKGKSPAEMSKKIYKRLRRKK